MAYLLKCNQPMTDCKNRTNKGYCKALISLYDEICKFYKKKV